ncbi:signal peptidase I [Blochmannia endosymbiont of Camponotus (Colobopsis) obliquus]|uniref:signal peptidase I n=1 Tax=Blochmannia endosymbiont of Camponotus (Colobopsis) obliquus TaxID=1505597 RepID=UPI00061A82A9|nr:signal peptidase I [Blochmannia endosymbiont of Camponotus (Colobopsis) obliquus]AKC60690.1 signal peptidase I [Blochmannia endosymbiont of Camponotus (Colobopsis) obliquus]
MINEFSLILAIGTCITAIVWFLKYFKLLFLCRCFFDKICNASYFIIHKKSFFIKKVMNFFLDFLEMCASIFPMLLFVFIIRSFIFEPFQIPSGSMMPTLLVGDFILVKKFSYGIKNPITQNTLMSTGHPKRGDVVVFKYPLNTKLNYIKRVIGLPGDKIVYNTFTKHVSIYPNCASVDSSCVMLPITYTNVHFSKFVQVFRVDSNREIHSSFSQIFSSKYFGNGIRLIQSIESLDGVNHNILTTTIPTCQQLRNIYHEDDHHNDGVLCEWYVPQGEYFMMGDNRDNSSDSRYWGCVAEKNIIGQAIIIWMSFEKQENQWPTGLRLGHIGFIH